MTVRIPVGRTFTALFLALLALGIALAYSGGFGIGFNFDDTYGIAQNPAIRSLRNIPRFFTDPYTTWVDNTQVDLRPILLITYAINYAVSGLQPWSYHVVNLLLHFTAAALVFVIVRDHVWWPAGEARIPAAAAALFFALAPVNTQPVDYVWARSALLCVTLYLGAFLAFLRRRWTLGSVLFALALLTKAIAVTLPVTLLVHDFIYRDRVRYPTLRRYVGGWRRLVLPVLLPAVLDIIYVAYRAVVLPGWTAQARQAAGVTSWTWFMSQWPALLYYVRLFLWPDGLSVDHDFPYTTSLLAPRALGSLLVLVIWVVLALRAARKHPQVTFATAWFLITLAPESSFAPLAEVINDHRPYIATSLGLSVLLTWVLCRGAEWLAPRVRQAAFVGACLLLAVPAIAFDRYRTWQWSDSLRIWEDTVEKSPNNTRAWTNAGQELMSRGDFFKARRYFERAREIGPAYAWVYMNLSVLDAQEGRLDDALRDAQEAVRLRPDHSRSHFYLGRALERLGRRDEAVAAYQRSVAANALDVEAQSALARLGKGGDEDERLMTEGLHALQTLGDPLKAAAIFRQVLEHTRTHYGATYQLAVALDAAGLPDEARPLWEKMLDMARAAADQSTIDSVQARLAKPRDGVSDETTMQMGLDALYKRHDAGAAVDQFRSVLRHTPTHYGATFQLAVALDAAGKPEEARPVWERILPMAQSVNDPETVERARTRLQQRP